MLFPIPISSNARNVDPNRGMTPAPWFNHAPKQKREGFLKVWVRRKEGKRNRGRANEERGK